MNLLDILQALALVSNLLVTTRVIEPAECECVAVIKRGVWNSAVN